MAAVTESAHTATTVPATARAARAPYTPSQTNSYASPPLMNTCANPLPLMYEQQQPPSQQSSRSSSNVHAVKSAGRDAPQMRTSVKLNGALIEGALVDSGSSLSLVTTTTLSKLPKRTSILTVSDPPPEHRRRWQRVHSCSGLCRRDG